MPPPRSLRTARRTVRPRRRRPDSRTLDGLGRLVDRSLVVAEHGGATRFRMLETIRQYGRDRLIASGESSEVRDRHLARFRRMAEEAGPALEDASMLVALDQVDLEIDNVRAALDWAFEVDPESGVRLVASLGPYWRARSMGAEGLDRLAQAIEALRTLPEPSADEAPARTDLAIHLLAIGAREAAMTSRRVDLARDWADEAVRLARESGDRLALSFALSGRGFVLMFAGRSGDDVIAALRESAEVAAEAGDWVSLTFAATGMSEFLIGIDIAEAEAWVVRATDAAAHLGNPFGVGLAALARGRYLGFCDDVDGARRWFLEAETQFHSIADRRMELVARSDLAHAMRRAGRLDEAEASYVEVMPQWQRLGHRGAVANLMEAFAFVAIERGDPRRGAELLGAAARLREAAGSSMLTPERVEYDRWIAQARSALGDTDFDDAWRLGDALTTDDAVALAVATREGQSHRATV